MVRAKFIRCRNCDAIHHISPFDKAPVYTVLSDGIEETSTDDWREFMQRHANHKLEPLESTGEQHFTHGSPANPMGVGYIEVTNGYDHFLLRRSRKSITEPLTYELIEGTIVDHGISLEIQENEIKKEMKYHFTWTPAAPLDDNRIDFFIGLLKEWVKGIDPKSIKVSEYSYIDDGIAYGLLDPLLIDTLMAKCATYFLPVELDAIRRFVETHRESSNVMTLLVRRQFTIEQPIR
jgi:hypothetical protein